MIKWIYCIFAFCLFSYTSVSGKKNISTQLNAVPVANFTFESFCGGSYFFRDSSINNPVQWEWEFGDGSISSIQNPIHTYLTAGSFQVKLKVSSVSGTDSIVKVLQVLTLQSPLPPPCYPYSTSSIYPIKNIVFGDINKITGDTSAAFIDNSCSYSTVVLAGQSYPIDVTLKYGNNVKVIAWIDYNNDGDFNPVLEQVFYSDIDSVNRHGVISIPTTAVTNFPLRMRIIIDYYYGTSTPCKNIQGGQIQDFSIIIQPNNLPPICSFSHESLCDGTSFFKDSTSNNCATSWYWDFGDGTTSTLQNPIHKFIAAGIYSVKLKVCNPVSCDSISKLVQTFTVAGLATAQCTPATINFSSRTGIRKVQLNTINHSSVDASEGYKDYSCEGFTTLTAGDQIAITVLTDSIGYENVKIWIDFNNDGYFNNITEQVFHSENKQLTHTGIINTSGAFILNTPLRMRVCDDTTTVIIQDACQNLSRGQAEDYAVTFVANSQAPVANFTADYTTVSNGSSVHFYDISQHIPTSWHWYFTGGNPSASTLQNPTVVYNTAGNYPVSLVVYNANGQDSIIKSAFMHVTTGLVMCSNSVTDAVSGSFYDSGGPTGNYPLSQSCSVLIDPPCATSITLTFTQFNVAPNTDYLYVYNGTNSSAPLLASGTGNSIPNNITANSGKMFVVFLSNTGNTYAGWSANWTSQVSTSSPVGVAFSTSSNNPAFGDAVQFTDLSTNNPTSWIWDFGDGHSSFLQNPTHIYSASGAYNVTLQSTNCLSSDTISQLVTAQVVPSIKVYPDTLSFTLGCGDSTSAQFTILNTGASDLIVKSNTIEYVNDTVQILAFTGVADLNYEYTSLLNSLNLFGAFKKYKITNFQSVLPSDLKAALKDKDLLLFPSHSTMNNYNGYSTLSTVVNDFVSSGKTVVVCGSTNLNRNSRVYDLGLFNGQFISKSTNNSQSAVIILDTNSVLTENIANPISINGFAYQYVYNHITYDSNRIELLRNGQDYEILSYRSIGKGRAYNFGYDFAGNSSVYPLSFVLLNIFKTCRDSFPDWLNIAGNSHILHPGDSLIINFNVSSLGLQSGYFTKTIFVHSNDTTKSNLAIPVSLHITAPPNLALSTTCLNFDPLMKNLRERMSFVVSNNGCDTLQISGMQSSGNIFTAEPTVFNVPAGKSQLVNITFDPTVSGTFVDTLVLFNNFNSDTSICLTGTALESPIISLQPDSLSAILHACSDSVNLTAYIYNTGLVPLNYQLKAPVRILAVINYVDTASEFKNMISSISQYTTNFKVDTLTYTDQATLKDALKNHEIVLFPEAELGFGVYNLFYIAVRNEILDFVNSGGRAIVTSPGGVSYRYPIRDLGLMDAYPNSYQFTPLYIPIVDTTHFLMKGVPLGFYGANASCGYYPQDSSIVCLAGINQYSNFVMYKSIGLGDAIYIGFDYFESNPSINKILANAINIDTTGFPSWLSASPLYGSVLPGDSALISITLKSDGFSSGAYPANIFVASNDPLDPLDSIPITLNVLQNPCADFNFESSTCNGFVAFEDLTFNNPTSFTWDFGDGQYSNLQNPDHTYSTTGTFQVKLVACTTFSCDSISKPVTINSLIGPDHPLFFPEHPDAFYSAGIWHVEFNSINHSDNNRSSVYSDYSCSDTTTLVAGQLYTIIISTDTTYSYENVGVWIDFNNDNNFDSLTEAVFTSINNFRVHSGNIIIPGGTVLNQPLRLRICADLPSFMPIPYPNYIPNYGETEDYAVIITPNQTAPFAKFYYNQSCAGSVSFIDSSYRFPTSWFWDFGDGTTSTLQNDSHIYSNIGTYTVKLHICNAFGCDSISQAITIASLASLINTSCNCASTTYDPFRGGGITKVVFNTIFKVSPDAIEGYQDNSCTDMTNVIAGLNYPILIDAVLNHSSNIKVWIDWNNDGVLDSIAELAFSSIYRFHNYGNIFIPPSAVLNTPLRMRVVGEDSYNLPIAPCRYVIYGQAEDYSVVILPNPLPIVCDYNFVQESACNGTVVFNDSSTNVPTSWLWDFGDGTFSTLQNPLHDYTSTGTFTVKLVVCKINFCDSLVKVVVINSLNGPRNCNCYPSWPFHTTTITTRVLLSTLDKTTVNSPLSYYDFSCTDSTNLELSTAYTIMIETSNYGQENAAAWIDYNNDGIFDPVNEELFSIYGYNYHYGYFSVPSTAIINTPLRMRVLSGVAGVISPCKDGYDFEDFKIIIKPKAPKTYFSFTQTCSGYVFLKDSTLNDPVSWYWDFGDATFSTDQNPVHHYSATGNYTIKLVVCNSNRCDSLSKNISISNVIGPIPTSCTPQTTQNCCGIGIINVAFNTINKTSWNGSEGYKDFSCSNSTTLEAGQTYLLSITTGATYFENVVAWIDFNNDGVFSNPAELVLTSLNHLQNHSGSVTIPSTAVLNTSLRLRIGDDFYSATLPSPCTNLQYGQFEDYSVIITSTSPVANFVYNQSCSNNISFIDSSLNFPVSWTWDFGDGSFSNFQNPSHAYAISGNYQVKLTVCNSIGCDSIFYPIIINTASALVPVTCTPTTLAYCCGIGISNVVFSTINKFSLSAAEGYVDFTCADSGEITCGMNYPITITTGSTYNENVRAWIDFNNDGNFDPVTEMVFSSNNQLLTHTGTVFIPANVVLNTKLRMRVGDELNNLTAPDACTNLLYGQYEDYTLTILPNTLPPIAEFSSNTQSGCNDIAYFTDLSLNVPTFWNWQFGDGDSSALQSPMHQYQADGNYLSTLIVSNAFGADTISKIIPITIFTDSINYTGNTVTGQQIQFNSITTNAVSYYWDFGDGHIAISASPQHIYLTAGTFIVSLIINNGNCIDTLFDTLNIQSAVGLNEMTGNDFFTLYPNPFKNELDISFKLVETSVVSLKVLNVLGEVINEFESEKSLQPGPYKYVFRTKDAGIYFVQYSINGMTRTSKVANIY